MRLNQPTTDRRLSYPDYLLFPADGNRHELLEGAHYMTPCPNVRHQRVVGRLHAHLWQHPAVRRHDGQLRLAAEVTNDPAHTLQSPLLPGLALALDRLFTDQPALRR